METLSNALDWDYNPSKGKGGHTKVTSKKISKEDTEEMFVIPHDPVLKEYQVDRLVKFFCSRGFYPPYLKDILIDKGLLPQDK